MRDDEVKAVFSRPMRWKRPRTLLCVVQTDTEALEELGDAKIELLGAELREESHIAGQLLCAFSIHLRHFRRHLKMRNKRAKTYKEHAKIVVISTPHLAVVPRLVFSHLFRGISHVELLILDRKLSLL